MGPNEQDEVSTMRDMADAMGIEVFCVDALSGVESWGGVGARWNSRGASRVSQCQGRGSEGKDD